MKAVDFDLLDWLVGNDDIRYNLGSSCLTFLKLTDFPGYDAKSFDFTLDCGTDMGDPELKRSIAEQYGVEERNVAITGSASEGNFLVESLYSPSRFLVESPTYEPLWKLASVLDSRTTPIYRDFHRSFRFDTEALKERIKGHSLFVMTNLHNPSGVVLGKDEMREIVEICGDSGATVLVDEIFRRFSDPPSAVDFGENVVINSSPSKFFGACGLRIGHLVGQPEFIRDVERLKMMLTPNTSVLSQRAYLLITRNMEWFVQRGRKLMERNMTSVVAWVNEREDIEWVPSEGNIAFPRLVDPATGEGVDTMSLGTLLKEEYKLLVTPGKYFGNTSSEHFRIGYGIPYEDLKKALEILSRGLDTWWDRK